MDRQDRYIKILWPGLAWRTNWKIRKNLKKCVQSLSAPPLPALEGWTASQKHELDNWIMTIVAEHVHTVPNCIRAGKCQADHLSSSRYIGICNNRRNMSVSHITPCQFAGPRSATDIATFLPQFYISCCTLVETREKLCPFPFCLQSPYCPEWIFVIIYYVELEVNLIILILICEEGPDNVSTQYLVVPVVVLQPCTL